MTYVVQFKNKDNGKSEGMIFTIKRSKTPLADIDLKNLGAEVINVDAAAK
ncbi:MAG: hypothetical protein AAF630_03610 [Cyanobacteria bacterium P01_C01_bin.38]